MIHFSVPMEPVAQPRHRVAVAGGRPRIYGAPSSHRIHDFKAAIRLAASAAVGCIRAPYSGPVSASLLFILRRPQAKVWKTREMPRERHTGKPDVENLAKGVLDALTGVAWIDDRQVSDLVVCKRVASGSESPRLIVMVERLDSVPALEVLTDPVPEHPSTDARPVGTA